MKDTRTCKDKLLDYKEAVRLLGLYLNGIPSKRKTDAPDSECLLCNTDNENSYFHAFGDGGVCEECAMEYGCSCGCFPSITDQVIRLVLGCEIEKDIDTEQWVFVPPYENNAFEVFVKDGKASLNSLLLLDVIPFINDMGDNILIDTMKGLPL